MSYLDPQAGGASVDEGSWSPVFRNSSNDYAMAIQEGWYQKIGNCVHFKFRAKAGTITGSTTGQLFIGGLPFTSSADSNSFSAVHMGFGGSLGITADETVSGYVKVNDTEISLQIWTVTTGTAAMNAIQLTDDGGLMGAGFYYVD
jgi:hypothetical protein